MDDEVLVEVRHGRRTVAIKRGPQHTMLTSSAGGGIGIPDGDGFRPTSSGEGGATAVGGMLPPGAVDVRITDLGGGRHQAVVGAEAWLAVLDEPLGGNPAVCFLDADGEVLRPSLPARWSREPIGDADEACPACSATTWEQVTPNDGSRGGHRSGDGP